MLAVGTEGNIQSETHRKTQAELEEGTGLGGISNNAHKVHSGLVHSPNGETSLSKNACKKTNNSNLSTIMASSQLTTGPSFRSLPGEPEIRGDETL